MTVEEEATKTVASKPATKLVMKIFTAMAGFNVYL